VVELLIALVAWRGLAYRDLQGFTRLDRFLWLNVGLDAGYAAVGLALAITGWQLGRRLGLVGAGVGVVVQGLALLVLDAYLIGVLNRVAAG
jgi:sulfite exporter TauE/SafE